MPSSGKGPTRPRKGGSGGRGRPPGRWDKPPKMPPNTGRGTTHKSSSVEGSPIIGVVYALAAFVILVVGSVTAYMVHGYGLI